LKRAYVEINLTKYAENINRFRTIIPAETKLMAVVKADAYGHGANEISDVAVANGIDYLGVAWVSEAIALREAGIKSPILILSEPTINIAADIVRLDVTQTVYTLNFARALSDAAKQFNKIAKIHIKIDTGMNRIGVNGDEATLLVEQIHELDNIFIEGVFTHFAKADTIDDNYTLQQVKQFTEIVTSLEKKGYSFPIKHCANTAGTFNYPSAHVNMVRVGIGSYQDVLTFKSRIAYVKRVPKDSYVSYSCSYKTEKETTIATLSVGYADGLVRALSNKGHVIVNGKKYPIVGRICMDMTMIDLGDDIYHVGEEVILIGSQGSETISVEEVAELAGTISYEILCGIGKRVNRIYHY